MKIQEFESLSGLERATIRYYEKEGLLSPKRTENGYRDYSEADLEEVKKIKLLRQLGMPLESIRRFQQGTEDFSAAMEKQIAVLGQRVSEQQWAQEVCREIRACDENYGTLNADHYLDMLRRPQYQRTDEKSQPQELPAAPKAPEHFREKLHREIHPWRRFLARMVDQLLFVSILNYILYVVLRLRMVPDNFGTILSYAAYWLIMPVEIAMLCFAGTTPGKWIFGIELEYYQGGKLPFEAAMSRSFRVLRYGLGFGIPIWNLIRLYKSHTTLEEYRETVWDDETEVTYRPWNWKGKILLAAAVSLIIALNVVSVRDQLLPRHRGELTIQEFSENYRFYHEKVMDNTVDILNDDGTWFDKPEDPNTVVFDLDGTYDHETADFIYELENGGIKAIRFEDEWSGFRRVSPLPDYLVHAAIAYVAAQPGMTADKLYEWAKAWEQAVEAGTDTAFTVDYCGVRIHWEIECENCVYSSIGMMEACDMQTGLEGKTNARMHLIFTIEKLD